MADLLVGSMGVFAAHDQTFLGATTGRRWKLFRPFVQDDWRVTNNLTLNLGFAWALATPETEEAKPAGGLRCSEPQVVCAHRQPRDQPAAQFASLRTGGLGIQFDKTALEPRIGFAWKPMGSEKTVGSRRLRDLPRFRVESRRTGIVAEPAVLCGS